MTSITPNGKPGILRRSIRSAEGCLRSSSGQSYDRYVNEPYAILEPRPPLIRGRRRLQVRGDLIYGTPGRGDYRVRLVAAETQGWRKPEDVALRHGPGDHPALEQRRRHRRPHLLRRIEEPALGLVFDEFDRAEETLAPHLADDRMIGQGL